MLSEIGEGEAPRRSKWPLSDEAAVAKVRKRPQGASFLVVAVVPLLVFFHPLLVALVHGARRRQERWQWRAGERGVRGPPRLAHQKQTPAFVEGVLRLGHVPGAGAGDVGEDGEGLGLPREEIGQSSPAPI